MNRTPLIQAFEQTATADGYHFHCAEERYIQQLAGEYPVLWLTPPTFHSKQGRTHGKISYEVTAHAISRGAKIHPEERNTLWSKMEQDLIHIFSSISEREFVIAVEELKIRHSSHTLTPSGEVVATATAKVITFY